MVSDCSENRFVPENLELFYDMVENARDGINITQNGVFRYVNKAFCEMVGYTREELCCMGAADLLPDHQKERMMRQHFDRMDGTGKFGLDYTTLLHKNGSEIDIEFNASPINFEGKIASFISIRDITERKQMQHKLELSEQKYRNLVENAHDGIIITQFGKFKFVNKAFNNIIEYSEEELIESPFLMVVAEEDRERLTEYHRMRMSGEKHQMIYEAKGITKSGKVKYFEINTSFIEYNGHPATFIILRDHTSHHLMEDTLKASEKKYRRLFEAESDAIFLIDKETGKILDANPAATKIYGYSHEEFLTLRNVDISAEPDKTRIATAEDHNFVPIRYHLKKDGSAFAVEISAGVTELDCRQVHIITARDITERLRMQTELYESEQKYRTLIEKSLDGIVISQDGGLVLVNQAFANMMGYSVEECMQSFGPESIVPEDRDRVMNIHNLRMKGQLGDMRYNASMICKNGERVTAEFNSTTIEINGKIASFITTRDITQQIRMQEALEKSERKYRELADLLPQTVYELDADGFITYMNTAGRRAFGMDDEEIGFHSLGGIIPEDRIVMQQNIEKAKREHRLNNVDEYTALRKDGKTFPALFYSAAMIEDGVHIGTRGLVIDISERKAMEEALEKSERKYRELADLLPQTIFELDLNGNVTYLNKAGRMAFGYPENEVGFPATSGIIPEDHEKLLQNIKLAYIEKGRDGGMEYTALRRDGTTFPIIIYSSPMTENNQPLGVRGLIIDISERKAMEEALEKSERKYRELADLLPQTIYELDELGYITYLNKTGQNIFGFNENERKVHASEVLIPEDRIRMMENLQRAIHLNIPEGLPYEYTAIRKDGTTFPVITYASDRIVDGKFMGSKGLIIDIRKERPWKRC